MDNYRVTYGIADGGGETSLLTPPNQLSVTLNGLQMGTEYDISVLGINSVGDGPSVSVTESTFIGGELATFLESNSFNYTTISQAPSAPGDFQGGSLNPFTISVSWRESETNGGSYASAPSLP